MPPRPWWKRYSMRFETLAGYFAVVVACTVGVFAVDRIYARITEDNTKDIDTICSVVRGVIDEVAPIIPRDSLDAIDARLQKLCPRRGEQGSTPNEGDT